MLAKIDEDILPEIVENVNKSGPPWNPRFLADWEKKVAVLSPDDMTLLLDMLPGEFAESYKAWTRVQMGPAVPLLDAGELMREALPPIDWIVEGILSPGVSMLAAPPKSYKSFMCLQLCAAVSSGVPFLGRKTQKSGVLYMDLESGKRRPQTRLKTMFGEDFRPSGFYIVTAEQNMQKGRKLGRIGAGFEETAEAILAQHPDIRLLIVDVWREIRAASKGGVNAYEQDYSDLAPLRSIAIKYGVCILLVHHLRKMGATDPYERISGSVGTFGALDAALVITREARGDDDAVLHITGRDVESQELAIRLNRGNCIWEYEGTSEEREAQKRKEAFDASPVVRIIEKALEVNGGHWIVSAEEIRGAGTAFGIECEMDIRQIGREIRDYQDLLWGWDRISVKESRNKRSRVLEFTKA